MSLDAYYFCWAFVNQDPAVVNDQRQNMIFLQQCVKTRLDSIFPGVLQSQ